MRNYKNMRANNLIKKPIDLKKIYKDIEDANNRNEYRYFINPFIYISDEVKLELLNNGFKVYSSKDFNGLEGLVVEW